MQACFGHDHISYDHIIWLETSLIILHPQSWHPSSSMKTIHRPIKQQQSIPLARPYNVYNIFFILERARIIQQFCAQDAPIQLSSSPSINFFGYELLSLPDLPPRYCDLILPPDWFVPGKNAKRKHVATNGRECKHRLCTVCLS